MPVVVGADPESAFLCHCLMHPWYTPENGHVVGHHSHTRLEAPDVDMVVRPCVNGGSIRVNG